MTSPFGGTIMEQDQTDNARLLETAQVLYREYVRYKSKNKHIRYNTERLDAAWLKTAETVLKLNTSPEEYMAAQFKTAKATLFPNMLYGANAVKRYKQYCVQQRRTVQDTVELPQEALEQAYNASQERPAAAELRTLMTDTYAALKAYCHSQDITMPDVREQVLKMHLFFDPVCMMLMSPTSEFKQVFGLRAKLELQKNPTMRQAAMDAGFDIAVEYIEEEDYDG